MKKELKFSGLLLIVISIIFFIEFYYFTYINNLGYYFIKYTKFTSVSKVLFILKIMLPISLILVYTTIYRLLSKKNKFVATIAYIFGILSSLLISLNNLKYMTIYNFLALNYKTQGVAQSNFIFDLIVKYFNYLLSLGLILFYLWFILNGIAIMRRSRLNSIVGLFMILFGIGALINLRLQFILATAIAKTLILILLGINMLLYKPLNTKVTAVKIEEI